jgi:hypothetical protein
VNVSGARYPRSAKAALIAARSWGSSGRGQRDRRAAEAAAGHPGAERALILGDVDGEVKFRGGDLEVVAHRGVRGEQQAADRVWSLCDRPDSCRFGRLLGMVVVRGTRHDPGTGVLRHL